MGNDEKIFKAFKKAEEMGMKRLSFQSLVLVSELPPQVVSQRLNSLKKYGMIKETEPPKKHKLFYI